VPSSSNVTPNPTPAAASIASIPAPIVVPATIKILPSVLFFTLSSTTTLPRQNLRRRVREKRTSSNHRYKWCNELFTNLWRLGKINLRQRKALRDDV
jgi:hypothetical protein